MAIRSVSTYKVFASEALTSGSTATSNAVNVYLAEGYFRGKYLVTGTGKIKIGVLQSHKTKEASLSTDYIAVNETSGVVDAASSADGATLFRLDNTNETLRLCKSVKFKATEISGSACTLDLWFMVQ